MASYTDKFLGVNPVDVMRCLRDREMSIPPFKSISPQLQEREWMIQWIDATCRQFHLSNKCIHLAVLFMDMFMDNYKIEQEQLYLLAISCIQISAKHEEMEATIPRPADLVGMIKNTYSNGLCMRMEMVVLQHLDWNLGLPTCAHFSELLFELMIHPTDSVKDCPMQNLNPDVLRMKCQRHLQYFLNLVLKDISYKQYPMSATSAAIIAAIRNLLEIKPPWPIRLAKSSGYRLNDICNVLDQLLKDSAESLIESIENLPPNDSGYHASSVNSSLNEDFTGSQSSSKSPSASSSPAESKLGAETLEMDIDEVDMTSDDVNEDGLTSVKAKEKLIGNDI